MIESVDIKCCGCFWDFEWSACVCDSGNNVVKFKKLNILYGRNYSGKTTLSRIIRCLHTGVLPTNYEDVRFAVTTDSGIVTDTDIPMTDLHIRVYNRDFVDEHLSFLKDDAGKIEPFAIIGSENVAIEQQIEEKQRLLGSDEQETGLRHQYSQKIEQLAAKTDSRDSAEKALNKKLTDKATQLPDGIKHNPKYRDSNYNTPKIRRDIDTISERSLGILAEDERKAKESLLNEKPLPEIGKRLSFSGGYANLYSIAEDLLTRKIKPSRPIQNLLDDAVLQSWVKGGIPHHRDKRKVCAFCGQLLPQDLWNRLDAHFSKESSALESELKKHVNTIERELEMVNGLITIGTADFYLTFHGPFEDTKKALEGEIKRYATSLTNLINSLTARLDDIFTPRTVPVSENNVDAINNQISIINDLVDKNNQKTGSLEEDQNMAREELRLSEVSQFIRDIDYFNTKGTIDHLEKEIAELQEEADKLHHEIQVLDQEITQLQMKLQDEKKGAEKINEYLNSYFGHNGLRLKAVEEDGEVPIFNFQICRGDEPAYNLSEGECSLVAFCYFMAKLNDSDSNGKPLVLFIDDPVSSLDTNHVFFVFSLIESLIARPIVDADGQKLYRYKQLFISTHNLDFLKYLRRLSRPKKDHEQFLIVGKSDGSTLEIMPPYLKNYITEFNYLFDQIYICANPLNAATSHDSFYNFGNNLRKFLEAYLFFKYPFSYNDERDYNDRIKKFFNHDPSTEALVQRLTNEFSHLGGIFDRSAQPIDSQTISDLAKFILKKIRENDRSQYDCLLQSIGKSDPFDGP